MIKIAIFAGGCFWGEPVWETGSRLIEGFCELHETKYPMSGQPLLRGRGTHNNYYP